MNRSPRARFLLQESEPRFQLTLLSAAYSGRQKLVHRGISRYPMHVPLDNEVEELVSAAEVQQVGATITYPVSAAGLDVFYGLAKLLARIRRPKVPTALVIGGVLLAKSPSDFFLSIHVHLEPEIDRRPGHFGLTLDFIRKPNQSPPKDLEDELAAGRSVEWALEQFSGLAESGKRTLVNMSASATLPPVTFRALGQVPEALVSGRLFRCTELRFSSDVDVGEGLASFRLSEEGSGRQRSSRFDVRYRKWVDSIEQLRPDEEKAAVYTYLRDCLRA